MRAHMWKVNQGTVEKGSQATDQCSIADNGVWKLHNLYTMLTATTRELSGTRTEMDLRF
jgi:hypothetical protein